MKCLIGEWAEGSDKLLKYPYQLMTREGESSLDPVCPLTVSLIGIASACTCRSREYLRERQWSPFLSGHDSRGLAKSGMVLRPHPVRKGTELGLGPRSSSAASLTHHGESQHFFFFLLFTFLLLKYRFI